MKQDLFERFLTEFQDFGIFGIKILHEKRTQKGLKNCKNGTFNRPTFYKLVIKGEQ